MLVYIKESGGGFLLLFCCFLFEKRIALWLLFILLLRVTHKYNETAAVTNELERDKLRLHFCMLPFIFSVFSWITNNITSYIKQEKQHIIAQSSKVSVREWVKKIWRRIYTCQAMFNFHKGLLAVYFSVLHNIFFDGIFSYSQMIH